MPELPEIETIKRDLEGILVGKTIEGVRVHDRAILTGFPLGSKPARKISIPQFEKDISGKTIARFIRKGKYLVMEFSDQSSLIFHLRMTGQLTIGQPGTAERLVLNLEGGPSLCFTDRRRFGETFYSGNWQGEKQIVSLGLEPLHGELSSSSLYRRVKNRTASIHALLLNQKIICGLGNIYSTEALYEAGISPFKPGKRLSMTQCEKLIHSIRNVLKKSIQNRGYSMRTYVDAMGRRGRSQLFTKIYGKNGQSCAHCRQLLRKKTSAGRGVVYCPRCQK